MRSSTLSKITTYVRLTSTVITALCFLVYLIILNHVFDPRFPSVKPGLTVLPAVALALLTSWNILALTITLFFYFLSRKRAAPPTYLSTEPRHIPSDSKSTRSMVSRPPTPRLVAISSKPRLAFLIPDAALTVTLLVLGSIGFAHDDKTYLSNAMYKQYDDRSWLAEEIAGGCGMLFVVVLQVVILLTLVLAPRRAAQENAFLNQMEIVRGFEPPAYTTMAGMKGSEQKEKVSSEKVKAEV